MSLKTRTLHTLGLSLTLCLLAGCSTGPAATPVSAATETSTILPTASEAPAVEKYEPIAPNLCQALRETAAEALSVEFKLAEQAPFTDSLSDETGTGCQLTAAGDGNDFSDPQPVLDKLVKSVGLGWTEQIAYQANGPTGADTAMTRDMGLMLISVNWAPAAGVDCPANQPISSCPLTPEQKNYAVQIGIAQYMADFSLDGHWEDAAQNFSLDLGQEWKNIYGHHTVVAQGGSKVDSLDESISGSLQGKVATVQFKSSFSDEPGTAQITYVDVNTIQWKIITPPGGEYYLPAEAMLTRK